MSDGSTSLTGDLLSRDQEAQVQKDEADARKAAADADTSVLAKYKSLVPDLTGVATNTVTDNSTSVAFSGLVTYSALHHAAEIIADRIEPVLRPLSGPGSPEPGPGGSSEPGRPGEIHRQTILVTSQSDLLTSDLLAKTVTASLRQFLSFADEVLEERKE